MSKEIIQTLISIKKDYDTTAIKEGYDKLKNSKLERNLPDKDFARFCEIQETARDVVFWQMMLAIQARENEA